jgi:hypothetical protein
MSVNVTSFRTVWRVIDLLRTCPKYKSNRLVAVVRDLTKLVQPTGWAI